MPIEIRELVIRAVVDGRPAAPAPGLPAPAQSATPAPDLDALVARCVRDVLRELRRSRER